jgi:DNA-binding NarL/FixJ family response regulator
MRILIADDNALVREGIAEIIADNAWEVCGQVSNGVETLEQTRVLRPDLVLLDISMPGTNGLEIAATIKHEMPEIKVLIVSQHDFDQVLAGAQRELADGFIDKGRLGTDLAPTIAKIVDKV